MSNGIWAEVSHAFGEEHVAAAVHAARLSLPKPSDLVAVIGDGPHALATVALMLARGVGMILMFSQQASTSAVRAGVRVHSLPATAQELDEIRGMAGGYGPDLAFECTGTSEARRLAIELVRPAGLVVLVVDDGKPTSMSPNLLVFGDKRVLGSRAFTDQDLRIARGLIAGQVGLATTEIRKTDA